MNKHTFSLFLLIGIAGSASLCAATPPDTSLESVQNIADQVRIIERQLSALVLTLDTTYFPLIQKDIEALAGQLRAVLVGAHGGYGEAYAYRCRAALEAGYRVLRRLVIKIESTVASLETRALAYPAAEKKNCLTLVSKLDALKTLLTHECDAMRSLLV